MVINKEFLVGVALLVIGYLLGLATDIVKYHLTPRPRLVVLSYGEGQVVDDFEDNHLIIGNWGNAPLNDVLVTFDYAGFVDKDRLVVRSRSEYELNTDSYVKMNEDKRYAVRSIRFPQLLPGQVVLLEYYERYGIGANPLAYGYLPKWHVLAPSTRTENLAGRRREARRLFSAVKEYYPYDFNETTMPEFRLDPK